MSNFGYQGLYINLDRSADRRRLIDGQLHELGLADRYRRLPAVDGLTLDRPSRLKPGALGAFASHLAAVEEAAKSTLPTHIIEDDVVLGKIFAEVGDLVIRKPLNRFDLVFTEIMLPANLQALKGLKARLDAAKKLSKADDIARRFQLIDLAQVNFSCMTSYFVHPNGASKLAAMLRREWDSGPTLPVDIFLRREVHSRHVSAACLFPFATSIDPRSFGSSTIDTNTDDKSGDVLGLLRYAFYVDADFDGVARTVLDRLLERGEQGNDPQGKFLGDLFSIIISEKFHLV
jgi:GR25 family glycosyltransferase involved in LPS biosynthesis